MNSIKKIIYKVFNQKRIHKKALFVIRMIFANVICLFWDRFKKTYADTWLLGTGDDRYENNIRTFDQYLRKKGLTVIWVVNKSNVKETIWNDKKTVLRGSIKNYLIAINCYACCFTHGDWDVAPGLFRLFKHHQPVLLYIEHAPAGMKRSKPDMHAHIPADIQCCLSSFERSLKLNEGAKENTTIVTGFAGYDDYTFRDRKKPIRSVLVMPTWRDWDLNGVTNFQSTALYKRYFDLFNDETLTELVRKLEIDITFILHPTAARYFKLEKDTVFSDCRIKIDVITGNDGRMREKIISSDMLITDYSTLCLDFLYMKKNVLFYWYDCEEYEEKHGLLVTKPELKECVFVEKGEIVNALSMLLYNPEAIALPPLADEYFDYFDHDNCKRIFDEVVEAHDR